MGTLSVAKIRSLSTPGRYGDGDGLWLQVRGPENKSWLFRYMRHGRAREMGLGPLDLVSLADARQAAHDARRQLLDGIDPLEQRQAARSEARGAASRTFQQIAELFLKAREAGWEDRHRKQTESTLRNYAFPRFGNRPVASIATGDIMDVLSPIWAEKPEMASRVRARVEAVLDFASARGWRQGENPARWRGHLANLLPARSAVRAVEHHPALPWKEIGSFMVDLRKREGVAARALEFLILNASRSGEVRGAPWGEIARAERIWTIPPERMKAARPHRIWLSDASIALLDELAPPGKRSPKSDSLIFPGQRLGRELSDMALSMVLRRMGRSDLTVHGFRSTFRDWAAEATSYPNEVAEMALAHAVGSKVEAAYRRGDLLEKRARLMADWAAFCGGGASTEAAVVPFKARG